MGAPPSCRICGGSTRLAYPSSDPRRFDGCAEGGLDHSLFVPTCHRAGRYSDLYRCRECASVEQPGLPDAAALHRAYRRMTDEEYLLEERGRRRTAGRLLDLLEPVAPGARLLDVGCGHGLLLDEARRRGWSGLGLELSDSAARYARDRLRLEVLQTPLEELDPARGPFEAVVLADVLEHLEDPVVALDRCCELLAPQGALLIATPDPSSAVARLAGARWWGYLPAHTCLVPRATLHELVRARGLLPATAAGLVRSFSARYWVQGLAQRGGAAGALARALAALAPRHLQVSLSLGDEHVLVARAPLVRAPARPRVRDRGGERKVHAVIPAYRAERTIAQVADALPAQALDRALVVDDASDDNTVEAALAAGLEVLTHPRNRGYGAAQKSGYVRAARDGADIVVMVHGDNQYDPALAAEMTAAIEEERADVVIGSRLLQDDTIAGGMPRWKWLGNRALTWIENRGFERSYSEYHTGYRAFSIGFLATIPFLRNADGFVFDQQIFAQIVARDARVVELSIPTRYFLEASSVSFRTSVAYGLRTLSLLARFRLDRARGRWTLLRRPASELGPAGGPEGRRRRQQPAGRMPG